MKQFCKLLAFAIAGSLLWSACDATELDGNLVNPNQPDPSSAEIQFVFNSAELNLEDFAGDGAESVYGRLNQYVRYIAMTGGNTYDNNYTAVSWNDVWQEAYAEALPDLKAVKDRAGELKLTSSVGMAQVMEAYIYLTLVDVFGDVPFSQVGLGIGNQNPPAESGQVIYLAMLDTLDVAIKNLRDSIGGVPNDLFYRGRTTKWVQLANTLKFKAFLNMRLVDADRAKAGIAAILTSGEYIKTRDDDWAFPYSGNRVAPDSRATLYGDNYETGASDYISNSFMYDLLNDYSVADPRLRYYVYRQDLDATNEDFFTLDCQSLLPPAHYGRNQPYCTASPALGYWGRDHGNDDGIPPDGQKRTIPGVFPAGGRFDANSGEGVANKNGTAGARGAGILPMMLSSYVDFMRAEAALFLQTEADPKALLLSGVQKSMTSVHQYSVAFGETVPDAFSITGARAADVTTYLADVGAYYDAAGTDAGRMQAIGREYYKAAWTNGLETYNLYRRTGTPNDLQPVLDPATGTFPRTVLYPNVSVTLNSSINQKTLAKQVFWDTNPAGFIN